MRQTNTINLLNQLLAIQFRSLPGYIMATPRLLRADDEQVAKTLQHIATDQRALSARIAALVTERGGTVEVGNYPMVFTDTHDLSLQRMLDELVTYQKQDVAAIEAVVARMPADRPARELAEEALGSEKAHLESLEALASSQPA